MTIQPQSLPGGSALYLDPEPLLAAVPGLLGFTPERSLVILAFATPRELTATLRLDVTFTELGRPSAEMLRQLDEIAQIVCGYDVIGVVAAIVDDRFDERADLHDHPGGIDGYRPTFAAVARSFAQLGGLSAGLIIPELTEGARWYTGWSSGGGGRRRGADRYLPPLAGPVAPSGVLSNPLLSTVALQRAVYEGRPVAAKRSDLAELLAPRSHCDDDACRPVEPIVPPAPAGSRDADRVRLVVAQLARGVDGVWSCAEVNGLAEALSSVHARDMLLALGVGEHADDVERLWIRLARSLSGRAGAAAATLLAHQHYFAGRGALASIALERALDLDPEYHLAQLLDRALNLGMRPDLLDEIIDFSYQLAASVGVELPVRTRAAAGSHTSVGE